MADKHIVVAAHGHCFDGLVSAALFTYLRERLDTKTKRFTYRSCGYGPNMQTVPERWLKGDENAIVDFRYSPSTKLTWFFDHHPTAFANDAQREEAVAQKRRHFDAEYGSCTKLIADVGSRVYGVSFERFADLITWADRIDSADFDSAAAAIDRRTPIMQLAAVVEQHGDGELYGALAPRMVVDSAEDVAASDFIQRRWGPIAESQKRTQKRIQEQLTKRGEVAFVDLHAASLESSGKFVAYALAPECTYSVALLRVKRHYKISVGYNPWSGKPRGHDIAAICRRRGGGGHAVVGAFTVGLDRLDDAKRLADEVVAELNR